MNKEIIKSTAAWVIVGLLAGFLLAWLFIGDRPPAGANLVDTQTQHKAGTTYTCSMHPQVRQPEPGLCPLCGMELIPVLDGAATDNPLQVSLSPQAAALAGVETMVVGRPSAGQSNASDKLVLNGQLQVAENKVVTQVAHIPGRIEQLFVNTTGTEVRAGQALASVYSPELLAAQQELIQAAKLGGNYQGLVEAARQKLRQYRISPAQIKRIEQEGRTFDRLTITADASGIVTDLMVAQGEYLTIGQPLFSLAKLNTLWVALEAYESQLPSLQLGDGLLVEVAATGNTYPSKITFIDPLLNDQRRTVRVRAELSNPEGILRPQMLVTASLQADGPNQRSGSGKGYILPRSAVLWTGERSVVYLKAGPDLQYQMREVKAEPQGNGYLVTEGLSGGEEVVVNGTFIVDAAAQLSNKPSMMNRAISQVATPVNSSPAALPTISQYPASNEVATQIEALVEHYLALKNALIEANFPQAKKAASKLSVNLRTSTASNLPDQGRQLYQSSIDQALEPAQKISTAQTLDQQRAYFMELSLHILTLAETFANKRQTLYRQYCPMANQDQGAYWLSDEADIKNPYYGEMMLSCGETIRTF